MSPLLIAIITAGISAILGAGFAALFGIWQAGKIRKQGRAEKRAAIASALLAELDVSAELLDVDADIDNIQKSTLANEKLARVREATKVYDAIVHDVGNLPSPISTQIVRFYGRVSAKIDAMVSLANEPQFFTEKDNVWLRMDLRNDYEKHRKELCVEVEFLRDDLRNVIKSSQFVGAGARFRGAARF